MLEGLYDRARDGRAARASGDVDGAIAGEHAAGQRCFRAAEASRRPARSAFDQIATRKRGPVRARNAAQNAYIKALKQHELVFAEGPAGTGKTWLAVGHAVSLLEQGQAERLILSRPAVEAGERLGFLPGDMREKVDPYLRPIYDALYDFMEARHVERGLQTGMIEIAPLAFMRGRTLTNAVVLLDEAQNTTAMQMKMFLTRLGEGSRMIVTGDPTPDRPAAGPEIRARSRPCASSTGVEGIARIIFTRAGRRPPRPRAPDRHGLRRRRPGRARSPTAVIELDVVRRGSAAGPRLGDAESARAPRRRAAAFAVAPDAPQADVEISLLLTDDAGDARSSTGTGAARTRPTNVLSFPAADQPGGARARAISATSPSPTRRWRARRRSEGKSLADHFAHLVVHGVLHLLGYDHEIEAEAEIMEDLEVEALAPLASPIPMRDMAA